MATFRSSLVVAFVFLGLACAGAAEAPAPATVPADRAPEVMAQQEIEQWETTVQATSVAYSGRSAFVVLK